MLKLLRTERRGHCCCVILTKTMPEFLERLAFGTCQYSGNEPMGSTYKLYLLHVTFPERLGRENVGEVEKQLL